MKTRQGKKCTEKAGGGAIDLNLVKAMAHPLRYELLMKLGERVASPSELTQEVNGSIGTVAYHVRLLEQLGLVELVDEQPRRGATEHFYRATQRAWFENDGWSRLPVEVRRSMAGATLASIAKSVSKAAENNAFDAPTVHVSSTALSLDDEAYDQVCAVLDAALEEVLEIQAESLERDQGDRRTQLVLMHYDRG